MKCNYCGKEVDTYRALGIHLKKSHGISSEEYYEQYFKQPNEGFCVVCQQPVKFISLAKGYAKHCSVSCGVKDPETQEKYRTSCVKRYGTNRASQSAEVQEKIRNTCIERYGVQTVLNLPESKAKSKQVLFEKYGEKGPLGNNEIRNKSITTWQEKYGCDNPSKATEVKQKITSSKDYSAEQQKRMQTCIQRYGVDMPLKSPVIQEKIKHSLINTYGVDNPWKSNVVRSKIYSTKLSRYGNPFYNGSEKIDQKEKTRKCIETKKKNGTLNTSKLEDQVYELLCSKFGAFDVYRNYSSDVYPFNCDFYIKSLNLFLECNFHWTHGGHFFNSTDKDDVKKLLLWQEKATTSKFYTNAIMTWTKRDLLKKDYADKNKLNYLVFWNTSDVNKWFASNCLSYH